MKFTFKHFQELYPNEDACLDKLFQLRYGHVQFCPDCAAETTFHRVKRRKCYECKHCGYQIYPMAGTPFEKSRTSLLKWFHAMYLMTATRNGVSGKEIERHLGVTYKCAWRMGHQIRIFMGQKADTKLAGKLEIDEVYLGGHRSGRRGRGAKGKTPVIGIVESNGNVKAQSVPNVKRNTVYQIIKDNVEAGSHITTDEFLIYKKLPTLGMTHDTVRHRMDEYVNSAGNHTNSIEGFWSLLKRSISSTHVWVSAKHLDKYIDEFEFRYNNRHSVKPMFEVIFEALQPSSTTSQNPQND